MRTGAFALLTRADASEHLARILGQGEAIQKEEEEVIAPTKTALSSDPCSVNAFVQVDLVLITVILFIAMTAKWSNLFSMCLSITLTIFHCSTCGANAVMPMSSSFDRHLRH